LITIFISCISTDVNNYCTAECGVSNCAQCGSIYTASLQQSLVERFYQDVYLQIKILDGNNTLNISNFFPTVDIYSLLEINGSYDYFANMSGLTVSVEVNGFSDPTLQPKIYLTEDGNVVGYFVIVVTIQNGNVTGLQWDDGCYLCPDAAQCSDDFCTNPKGDCNSTATADCNIKLYVAWVGTDMYGSPCTSAGSLTSRLRQFSVTNVYNQAAGILVNIPGKLIPQNPNPNT